MGKGQVSIIAFLAAATAVVAFVANFSSIAANAISVYNWWFGKGSTPVTTAEASPTPQPSAAPTPVQAVVEPPPAPGGLDLPLSTKGEEWQVANPATFASMAGNWCSTLGMIRLDLRSGQARYKMEPGGRGWVPSQTWKFRQTLRLEPKDQQPLFFTHEGPDHIREVTRGDDGLNQIKRTSDILFWNCDRCLIEDSGMLTWCKGDHEYDVISTQRRKASRSNIPDFIDVQNMQTNVSVLLGRDTL